MQNLTENNYRHGRVWLGKFHIEWRMFYQPRLHLYLEKGGYFDNRIALSIGLLLFTIYLSYEFRPQYGFVNRKIGFGVHSGCIWLYPWVNNWDPTSWDRKYWCLPIKDWIMGYPVHKIEEGEWFEVAIPMHEGSYLGTARTYTQSWTYRFGYKIERSGYEFNFSDGGIPFAGKDWDMGDDGLCGISVEGSLERGIGHIVTSVLETRKRYGEAAETKGRVVYARNR